MATRAHELGMARARDHRMALAWAQRLPTARARALAQATLAEGMRRGYALRQVVFGEPREGFAGIMGTAAGSEGALGALEDNASWRAVWALEDLVPRLVAAAEAAAPARGRDPATQAVAGLAGVLAREDLPDAVRATLAAAQATLASGLLQVPEAHTAALAQQLDLCDPVRHASPALQHAVYMRDLWECLCCGATTELVAAHVVPWSQGGRTVLDNMQTLCAACAARKGTARTDYRVRDIYSRTAAPSAISTAPAAHG